MADILHSIFGRRFGLGRTGFGILNRTDGVQECFGMLHTVKITSAQLLALNATPQIILPAPVSRPGETTKAYVPRKVALYKPAGTAYSGIATGEDLVVKYTNASGAQCSGVIETTGFLDQATAQTRVVGMPGATGTTASDYAPVANAALVLHLLSGEITTGTSDLYVRTWFDIIDTVFTV